MSTLRSMLGAARLRLEPGETLAAGTEQLRAYGLAALALPDASGVLLPDGEVRPVPILEAGATRERALEALSGHPALIVRSAGKVLGALFPADLAPPIRPDLGAAVWAALSPADATLLRQLARLAGPDAQLALVGGAVRDALLGTQPLDLDVSVLGADVERLARASGLPFSYHPRYQNATLSLSGGCELDLVSARAEAYSHPGDLPLPMPGTLALDLLRRDFGLNALALPLTDGEQSGLLDPAGGLADLEARTLRPLNPHSLRDDASRLVRAARLAARLDLTAHPALLDQVPLALSVAARTPRLWAELRLALAEPRPGRVLHLLEQWGAGALLPGGAGTLQPLDARREAGETISEAVYAGALLSGAEHTAELAARLGPGEGPLKLLARARSDRAYPASSPEGQLRGALPAQPDWLRGADLLALGVPAGARLGAWLAQANARIRIGEWSRTQALAAVSGWLKGETG